MNTLDINAVLEHYGVMVKARGSYMTSCPFHDDRTPSLSVNTAKNVWRCHSCGEGGDGYTLIRLKEGVDFAGARALAADWSLATGDAGPGSDELSRTTGGYLVRRTTTPSRKGTQRRGGGYVPPWRRGGAGA